MVPPGRQPTTWPSITATAEIPLFAALATSVTAGVGVALSLPPFGWWPLALVALALVARCLHRQPLRRRVAVGAVFGLGQFAIGLWWVTEFNQAGYFALVVLSMAFMAAAMAAVAARRRAGVLIGLPAALTMAEWLRGHVPFGGLPLGGIPLGQAGGPLVPAARVGGPILLGAVSAATGTALAVLAMAVVGARRRGGGSGRPPVVAAAVLLATVVAIVAAGRLGPDGSGPGTSPRVRVAAIQGGGPRGLRARAGDPQGVFHRQVTVTEALTTPVDLVLWPEDVVSVDQSVVQTPEGVTIAGLAERLRATVVAGVVEDVGRDRFRNAAVAWSPTGVIVARYDKAHRVPFGEYIPGRGAFEYIANLDLVPRDAIAGHGPGLLATPAGPLATVISYEVFFSDRARAAVRAGGELLIVPTNASSYLTSQVPTQEVAAARLRAWETGRDTVQAAPTGYSALIDHNGRVLARSQLGRPQAVTGVLTLRSGRTWFVRFGELPVLVLAILGLIVPLRPARHPG